MRTTKLLPGLLLIVGISLLAPPANAWGPNGHRTVALIAERNLTEAVRTQVRELLAGESLPGVSNWADFIRSFPRWSCADPFHYSTIPEGANYLDDGVPPQGDALGAIAHYFQVLKDPNADRLRRGEAIRFLTHIIGDLHQPLHVGLGCDRGGNDVIVRWLNVDSRLHAVWDSGILDLAQLSYTEYADLLVEPSAADKTRIQSSGPFDWARESQELLEEVYRCSTGQDRCACLCGNCSDGYSVFGGCRRQSCQLVAAPVGLGYEYRTRAEPIIARRLQEAGLRLAAVLNAALGQAAPGPAFSSFLQEVSARSGWDGSFRNCPAQ